MGSFRCLLGGLNFWLAQHVWNTSKLSSIGSNADGSLGMSKKTFSKATPPMLCWTSRRSRSAAGSSRYRSAARYSGEFVSRYFRASRARCWALGAARASAMSPDTARSISSTMRKAFSHSMSLESMSLEPGCLESGSLQSGSRALEARCAGPEAEADAECSLPHSSQTASSPSAGSGRQRSPRGGVTTTREGRGPLGSLTEQRASAHGCSFSSMTVSTMAVDSLLAAALASMGAS
mmetsp:Transcript_8656/g.24340  ORF Transcript_8656/g.24340 Transcript_8656/m.24340 type:complete len:235 (-) Transcript_8656:916-1620(-)